jgi:hypothetical protein
MAQPQKRIPVRIALEEGQDIKSIVNQLRSAGLKIEQVMDQVGAISGSVDSKALQKIRKIKGIARVEEASTYQIPPPDSEVQ